MHLFEALRDVRAQYARENPKSAAAHVAASKFLPGGNTRSPLYHSPFPLTFGRGEGAYLTDLDGHDYTDFLGEFTAGVFGHTDARLLQGLSDTASKGLSLGGHNIWEPRLAEALCARFPALQLVRFTNSGTEANLFAIATARAFTKRNAIMTFRGGYHGGLLAFANPNNPMNVPHEFVVAKYNDLEGTRFLIEQNKSKLAALIIEPMMSSAGCIPADVEFLKMLREISAKHGILLIFDEIVTSRLAPKGVHAQHGISPDLVTLGKYVGGGLGIGVFGGRAEIMTIFDPRSSVALPHGGTFNNNVLTMRNGYIAMTEVYGEEAATKLNAKGDELRGRLRAVVADTGLPMSVTGMGAISNVHMVSHEVRSFEDLADNNNDLKDLYYFHLLSRGIYAARRGMINLSLPMIDVDLNELVEATKEFIVKYRGLDVRTISN